MGFVERLQRASEVAARVSWVAREESAAATVGHPPARDGGMRGAVERLVAAEVPELLAALGRDREVSAFARWGLSTVIDENLEAPVISRALFDFLHERAGLVAAWPIGNAGVLHVYGYLLSTVSTPYGLKRERWLTPELTTALGMPEGAFLNAVTGSVAGAAAEAVALAVASTTAGSGLAGYVADSVLTRPDSAVAGVDEFAGEEREEVFSARYIRVRDVGDRSGEDDSGVDGERDTDRDSGGGAVAYLAELGGSRRLITVFPMASSADEWLAGFTAEAPRLRYNAAAHELPPRSPLARRLVFGTGALPPA